MTSISLDIILIDTFNPFNIAVGDMTVYPSGYNVIGPSIQITPPNFNSVVLDFTPRSVNLYDSFALGITCEGQDKVKLPDGLYTFKYTFTPAYTYFVEKTFMKVDGILEMLDSLFISLDISQCDKLISDSDSRKLSDINMYIQFAIAAANKCSNKSAVQSYQKAVHLVNQYNKSHCTTC